MPSTEFDPIIHGFAFPNRFVNEVARLPTGDRIRTGGRCGGMSYAALDIFGAGKRAPTATFPGSPHQVPPDGTPLADYLLRRQLDSFREPSAARFVAWTLFPDSGGPWFGGVRRWTAEEVPKACVSIDQGRPVVLGLVGASKLGDVGRRNHQVVACAYTTTATGVRFDLYDCNTPGRRVTLDWHAGSGLVEASNRRRRPWRGLFVHPHRPVRPPASIWR